MRELEAREERGTREHDLWKTKNEEMREQEVARRDEHADEWRVHAKNMEDISSSHNAKLAEILRLALAKI
jgi:hypothetical protein